jgi:hypothetical protein
MQTGVRGYYIRPLLPLKRKLVNKNAMKHKIVYPLAFNPQYKNLS